MKYGFYSCLFDGRDDTHFESSISQTINLLQSIEVLSRVVVRVHFATELGGNAEARTHQLVSLVVGDVQLEEARVCLRESRLVHAFNQSNLMLVRQVAQVHWQAAPTPNELQVGCALCIVERLKHTPESGNDLVVCAVVREFSYRLETLNSNLFVASATSFKSLPI